MWEIKPDGQNQEDHIIHLFDFRQRVAPLVSSIVFVLRSENVRMGTKSEIQLFDESLDYALFLDVGITKYTGEKQRQRFGLSM